MHFINVFNFLEINHILLVVLFYSFNFDHFCLYFTNTYAHTHTHTHTRRQVQYNCLGMGERERMSLDAIKSSQKMLGQLLLLKMLFLLLAASLAALPEICKAHSAPSVRAPSLHFALFELIT